MAELSLMSMNKVIHILEQEDFKGTLIKSLNENINIPIIGEETEASILDALYGSVLDSLRAAHDRALLRYEKLQLEAPEK